MFGRCGPRGQGKWFLHSGLEGDSLPVTRGIQLRVPQGEMCSDNLGLTVKLCFGEVQGGGWLLGLGGGEKT